MTQPAQDWYRQRALGVIQPDMRTDKLVERIEAAMREAAERATTKAIEAFVDRILNNGGVIGRCGGAQ